MRNLCLFIFGSLLPLMLAAQTDNEFIGTDAGGSITNGDYNTAVGESALFSVTTGHYNVALGYKAGYATSSSLSECVYVGSLAGYNNTGGDCTFIGHQAGLNNLYSDNTFIGTNAGYSNTTGADVTFIGGQAGYHNTSGNDNTFIGYSAGYNNTTASDNVYIGPHAGYGAVGGTGHSNVAIGGNESDDLEDYLASEYNLTVTVGDRSPGYYLNDARGVTLIGANAGANIVDGDLNTMVGVSAGGQTTDGVFNTFIGAFAGWDNDRSGGSDNGSYNTYVGFMTGGTNRDGEHNTGIGYGADFTSTTGSDRNSFFGADISLSGSDLVVLGYGATVEADKAITIGAYSESNADNAITIGYEANAAGDATNSIAIGHQIDMDNAYAVAVGSNATVTADSVVAIGAFVEVSGTGSIAVGPGATVTGSNSVALGAGASVTTDNTVTLGNADVTSIGGVANWTATSDGRLKTDVCENVPGLDFISRLRPVTYRLQRDKLGGSAMVECTPERNTGFIAQEVEAAATAVEYDFSGVDAPESEQGYYGLRYAEFVVPLVKAAQELSARAEANNTTLLQQQALIDRQAAEIRELEALTPSIEELEQEMQALRMKLLRPVASND